MRILIVDDCLDSRLLLNKYLAQFGRCDVATDGHEAVHAVRAAIEENQPFNFLISICRILMVNKRYLKFANWRN